MSELLNCVGDKWTVQVVVLRSQPHRFNELPRKVDDISQQMLTRTLKVFERDCLTARTVPGTTSSTATAPGTAPAPNAAPMKATPAQKRAAKSR